MTQIQTSVTNSTSLFYIIRFVLQGFVGIYTNGYITIKQKILLLLDYVRLTVYVMLNISHLRKYHKTSGIFYIRSFHLTLAYQNIFAFYYTFIETFCITIYPPMKNMSVYFDVGANNGIVSLWYHYWNPNVKIYAFEPDPRQFDILTKNMKINHITGAMLYRFGLGRKSGKQHFHCVLDAIYSLNSGLTKNQDLPYHTMNIEVKRLSTIIRSLKKRISLISMDIEGAEYDVLEDLYKTKVIRSVDSIVFESHHFTDRHNNQYNGISKKLSHYGTFSSRQITEFTRINTWDAK